MATFVGKMGVASGDIGNIHDHSRTFSRELEKKIAIREHFLSRIIPVTRYITVLKLKGQ